MKTCPNCKATGIPDDAKFCPNCGQRFFLCEGRGEVSDIERFLIVDIRQCKRVEGVGWNGSYEFSPGLPTVYSGFYAIFDEERKIQIQVENGKIDAIYVIDIDSENQDDYTLKFWCSVKTETSQQVTSYNAVYKNDKLISNKEDMNRAEIVLKKELGSVWCIYDKEFQDFFGISFGNMWVQTENWNNMLLDAEKVEKQPTEQPEQKSTSDKVERIIASIIFVGLMILGILMKEGVI